MTLDTSIPGFARIDEWPTPPTYHVTIAEFIYYRDGTAFAILEDANQRRYSICFDRFLGRLCFGGTHTDDDDVAFVCVGSPLAHSIERIFEAFVASNPDHPEHKEILAQINLIRHWATANEGS